MSTLKVSSINNASASSGGLSIDSSGVVSGALPSPNRNLLYNGAMQVSQRGTSVTGITTGDYRTADRWRTTITSLGTWTESIEADGPAGTGLTKSLKLLCTTADAAPGATSQARFRQRLEGQDVQRIAKGTASAQQLILSFWVKSNVTGTYIVGLNDDTNTRHISAAYTISASATWERKIITFPADTTGTFANDNSSALSLSMWLAAGSNFTSGTLQTTWASTTSANTAVGQTNLAAATNNYWQITGVQLEVGDAATDFEFKSYGQELAECQRYYWRAVDGTNQMIGSCAYITSSRVDTTVQFPVSMRTTPSIVQTTGTSYFVVTANGAGDAFNDFASFDLVSVHAGRLIASSNVSGTAGHGGNTASNNASASLAFSAEL